MHDFEAALHATTQWMLNYHRTVADQPVMSQVEPGDILKQLPESPNQLPIPYDQVLKAFEHTVIPGITHWQHPRFMAYFPSNSSPPSVLAEMLIASMGVQGMTWTTSPAATELEIRMMEWLREMFGLPNDFTGVIQDSASAATMTAMVVAREQATNFASHGEGDRTTRLVAYCSKEAHSSVEKAMRILGLGAANLRKIQTTTNLSINLHALRTQIESDLSRGLTPFFLVGAFGTTSTTAVDDLDGLAQVAKAHNMWFHVDAAYAGSALLLPEIRPLAKGIALADSVVVNPHKWLGVTFDCSAFFLKNPAALQRALSINPEYLRTHMGDRVTDFRDWGLGLGRRFRSLKLWFVIQWYGVEGLQELLRGHIALATSLAQRIEDSERFELVAQRHFNLVCFRLIDSDEANESLLNALNATGEVYLTHTLVNGRYAMRLVTGQTQVSSADVDHVWELLHRLCPPPSAGR
jgi:aromatic-L-amino-acid decarboxylase